jgi:predicted HTH transcriptional regulator
MARKAQILRLLAVKPRTNAELQELCVDHSAGICRTMSKLIAQGKARIIAGGGRGHPCTYARTDHAS